jgi:cysteine desulfurase
MAYVYLDHNATTPLHPRVRDAMVPWLGERFGNPSSIHRPGQSARAAVEEARARVAGLLGAEPAQIVFLSSGTEANNTVVQGAARRARFTGRLVVSALEHPSIAGAAGWAEEAGMEVVRVAPESDGVVPAEAMVAELTDDTRLVCLMLANNELGTLQPVAEVARACRHRGIPVLADAVQAVGKILVDVAEVGADYLVLGGHKFYGPLGSAALWVRPGAPLEPLMAGGGQERRLRPSTENVPAIVGLGEASRLAAEELPRRTADLAVLRDRFEAGLAEIPGSVVHCAGSLRLPQTSHVAFAGVEGEALQIRLDVAGFAVSTGSACSSGKPEPSKTLLAMGVAPAEALSSLRVSVGVTNKPREVDAFLEALAREVTELRRLSA